MGQQGRLTTDEFARTTAKHAHHRLNEVDRAMLEITKRLPNRPPMFVGYCALCGATCKPNRKHCHAHSWAEGT